jgi:hypothetical protein
MDKSFDDLFNEFFGDGKKKKKPTKNFFGDLFKNKKEKNDDYINNIIKMLSDFNDVNGKSGDSMGELDSELGEPDEIIFYEKDGMYFEERIWQDEEKKIIKTTISDEPFKMQNKKTLEEQLEEAIENEEYELAADLRDKIKKNTKKVSKKLDK